MIATFELGLRLAVAGRGAVVRSLSTAIGAAVATATLLATLSIAQDQVAVAAAGEQAARMRLLAFFVVILSLPIIVLLAVVSRLSARLRDKRLATLRLLGLTAHQARQVAVAETAVMAVIGTLVGAALFALVGLPILGSKTVTSISVNTDAIGPRPLMWAGILVAVPTTSFLITQVGIRHLRRGQLHAAHEATPRVIGWWRLAPLAAGVLLTAWTTTWPRDRDIAPDNVLFAVAAGGVLSNLAGLVLVVPLLVRQAALIWARISRTPSSLVAARRLEMEPTATSRLTIGLLVGLFMVAGSQCVIAAFEDALRYDEAVEESLSDPQLVMLSAWGADHGTITRFQTDLDRHDLGSAYPVHTLESMPEHRQRLYAVVTPCEALRHALPGLQACPQQPAWISEPPTGRHESQLSFASLQDHSGAHLRLPPHLPQLRWTRHSNPPALSADIWVPPTYQPAGKFLQTGLADQLLVATRPGTAVNAAVHRLHEESFPRVESHWREEPLHQIPAMRTMVGTIAVVIVGIGVLSFVIAAVDRAVERRRETAALHVLGVPGGVVRAAQRQQILLPLLIGIPLATTLGVLSGAALLAYGGALDVTPWAAVTRLGATSVAVAVAAALLTSITLSRRVSPELLRRE